MNVVDTIAQLREAFRLLKFFESNGSVNNVA